MGVRSSVEIASERIFHVRLEALAHCGDQRPVTAMPWVATVGGPEGDLVRINVVQASVRDDDVAQMAQDLFGESVTAAMRQATARHHLDEGDLVLAAVETLVPRADSDALAAYGLIRLMTTLRAERAYFTWASLGGYSVADLLHAKCTQVNGVIVLTEAINQHQHLLDFLFDTRHGLRLVTTQP